MKARFEQDPGKTSAATDMEEFILEPYGPSAPVKVLTGTDCSKIHNKMKFTEIDVPKGGTEFYYLGHVKATEWRDLAAYGRGASGLILVDPEEVRRPGGRPGDKNKYCARFLKVIPR
jgi:hypothetical protein